MTKEPFQLLEYQIAQNLLSIPGVLLFIGAERIGQDWVTELNWKKEVISELEDTVVEST